MITKKLDLKTELIDESSILFCKPDHRNILVKKNNDTGEFEVKINGKVKSLKEIEEQVVVGYPEDYFEKTIIDTFFKLTGRYPNPTQVNKIMNYKLQKNNKSLGSPLVFDQIVMLWIIENKNELIKEWSDNSEI